MRVEACRWKRGGDTSGGVEEGRGYSGYEWRVEGGGAYKRRGGGACACLRLNAPRLGQLQN